MILRARRAGVTVKVICNASVMGAIGATGLQLYSFGQTVSIPYFDGSWRPDSFVDRILSNRAAGLHTLCLLDIKVKEPDFEALARGARNAPPLPPRFMSVAQAVEQLLEVVEARRAAAVDTGEEPVVALDRSTLGVGCARLGQPTEQIIAATLAELCDPSTDLGAPLHSLVIPAAEIHELEEEYLNQFRLTPAVGADGASDLPPPPPASASN
jgi:diphthine synthase